MKKKVEMKSNGFKQTEIGLIAEDWEVVRLGEGLKKLLKNGQNYREKAFGPREKDKKRI
jgi:hypothetical protein